MTNSASSTKNIITKLDDSTIKLIAAGELYSDISSVVKELIDNSIDSNAKLIKVLLRQGGFGEITVKDDGDGISEEDSGSLCKRFHTSKIRSHEDLTSLKTAGFRGEALACLSCVAEVSISSCTAAAPLGFAAVFVDGNITSKKPVSMSKGTSVTVSQIFRSSHPQRRRLNLAASERARVVDLVTDYALHFCEISFSIEDNTTSSGQILLKTVGYKERSPEGHRAAVRRLFGKSIESVLLDLDEADALWAVEGLIEPLTFNSKSISRFVCIVNDRRVIWPMLKRSLRLVYNESSPKDRQLFFYLSVHLPPAIIDPNVDSSKTAFACKDESLIVQWLTKTIQARMTASASAGEMRAINRHLPKPPSRVSKTEVGENLSSETLENQLLKDHCPPPGFWTQSELVGAVEFGVLVFAYMSNLIIGNFVTAIERAIGEALIREPSESILKRGVLTPPIQLAQFLSLSDTASTMSLIPSNTFIVIRDGELISVPFLYAKPHLAFWLKFIRSYADDSDKVMTLVDLAKQVCAAEDFACSRSSHLKTGFEEYLWRTVLVGKLSSSLTVRLSNSARDSDSVAQQNVCDLLIVTNLPSLLSAFERC